MWARKLATARNEPSKGVYAWSYVGPRHVTARGEQRSGLQWSYAGLGAVVAKRVTDLGRSEGLPKRVAKQTMSVTNTGAIQEKVCHRQHVSTSPS